MCQISGREEKRNALEAVFALSLSVMARRGAEEGKPEGKHNSAAEEPFGPYEHNNGVGMHV